jgi:hypothetical protein
MDICPPAIATAASFVAVILIDLYNRNWAAAPGHGILGVFAVLLMIFICQKGAEWLAWTLLAAPFVLVVLAYFVRVMQEKQEPSYPVDPTGETIFDPCGQMGCPCCGGVPCHCLRPCPEKPPCIPKPKPKSNCRPKSKPCNESSYFELWLTTK